MKRWLAIIPLALVVLAAVMFAFKSLHRDSHVEPVAAVGGQVAKLQLQPLEGGPTIDLPSAIKGPALVNLFASWCGPCIQEHPALMDLKAKGVRIVGIAYEDKTEDTAHFLTQRGDPFELVLQDPNGAAAVNFGIGAIPETFLVDSSGKILAKWLPITSQANADEVLARYKAAR